MEEVVGFEMRRDVISDKILLNFSYKPATYEILTVVRFLPHGAGNFPHRL